MTRFRVAKTVYYETIINARSKREAELRAAMTVPWDECRVGDSIRIEPVKERHIEDPDT